LTFLKFAQIKQVVEEGFMKSRSIGENSSLINIQPDDREFDVVGIGSALLDFTVAVDDSFLEKMNFKKGQMHLIDEVRSREIFQELRDYTIETTPGGSSANTMAGIALLGGKSLFLGKVGNDHHGDYFISENEKMGVKTKVGKIDRMTGHAITFITPDNERTFATHLGAALYFGRSDISGQDISSSHILHMEAYLLENDLQRGACFEAMRIAVQNHVRISIDLADPALILRNADDFRAIVQEYASIVFVNEAEALAFTGEREEKALQIISSICDVAIVKLGEEGSLIKADDVVYRVPAVRTEVENTNGAGDMYAAGLLFGIAKRIPIEKAGLIGSYVSSLVVSQGGARLNERINIDEIL
jgi:sugar/nucleoside kinase (ribokinase family)